MAEVIINIASTIFSAFLIVAFIAFKQIKKQKLKSLKEERIFEIHLSYSFNTELSNSDDDFIENHKKIVMKSNPYLKEQPLKVSHPLHLKITESFDNFAEESLLELA